MKLIATESGLLLQFLALEELRPEFPSSMPHIPEMFGAIAKRYRFLSVPQNMLEAIKSGTKFENGSIDIDGHTIAVLELGIFNDGLMVKTRDTRTADIVLDDFLQWASESFHLRAPQRVPRRQYASTVIVEFSADVDTSLKALEPFLKRYRELLRDAFDWDYPVSAERLSFSMDPTRINKNGSLTIERRAGISYDDNRWFATAPLPTNQLIEILEMYERCLSKSK